MVAVTLCNSNAGTGNPEPLRLLEEASLARMEASTMQCAAHKPLYDIDPQTGGRRYLLQLERREVIPRAQHASAASGRRHRGTPQLYPPGTMDMPPVSLVARLGCEISLGQKGSLRKY